MIRKLLGVMTGMVLTASVGAASAAELGNKAQVPQILASLDRSGYEQLSAQKMAETVGTALPSQLETLLSVAFNVNNTNATTTILTPNNVFWPLTVTETTPGTNWTVTSSNGQTLNITQSGSNVVISTPEGRTVTLNTSTGGVPTMTPTGAAGH